MSSYSFSNFIETGISYIYTKLFFKKARLIRRPVYVRGKKGITYEEGLTLGHGCRIDAADDHVSLSIGSDARIGDYVHINADKSVKLGKNVLIASKVFISDASHGIYRGEIQSRPDSNPSDRKLVYAPVEIGDNVWIGENAVILQGSKIGNGCIIGANTLVNGQVFPDNTMIAGTPARVIKKFDETIEQWIRVSE